MAIKLESKRVKALFFNVIKKTYQYGYWLPKILYWKIKLKGIQELVYFGDRGIGDDLLCTAVLREMYNQDRRQVAMMSNWPELFKNLPFPKKVIPFKWSTIHCIEKAGIKVLRPSYNKIVSTNPLRFEFPKQKIITAMCNSIGISNKGLDKPEIKLSRQEQDKFSFARKHIVVQTSRANPRYEFQNKE